MISKYLNISKAVIVYLLVMLATEQIFGEVWRERRFYKTE